MVVKLHRCPWTFLKVDSHGCWRVENALDEAGIEYDVVKVEIFPRSRRTEVRGLTGQLMVPVVEFEDGTAYRAESKEMAATIRAGRLFDPEARQATAPPAHDHDHEHGSDHTHEPGDHSH